MTTSASQRRKILLNRFPTHKVSVVHLMDTIRDLGGNNHCIQVAFEGRMVFLCTSETKVEITENFWKEFMVHEADVDMEEFIKQKCFPIRYKKDIDHRLLFNRQWGWANA